jgi:hypothetical protein
MFVKIGGLPNLSSIYLISHWNIELFGAVLVVNTSDISEILRRRK